MEGREEKEEGRKSCTMKVRIQIEWCDCLLRRFSCWSINHPRRVEWAVGVAGVPGASMQCMLRRGGSTLLGQARRTSVVR